DVRWHEAPLRDSLQRLADTQHTAILLDRRIDPGQLIDFTADSITFEQVLAKLGESRDWSTSNFCAVPYLGPRQTANVLRKHFQTQLSRVNRLPRDKRASWVRREIVSWPTPAEPRELLQSWCRDAHVTCVNDKQIPFDQWSGQNWPSLNLLERATLLLAGFDLGVVVERDGALRIEPLAKPAPTSAGEEQNTQRRPQPAPNSSNSPRRATPADASLKRYTLTVKNQPRSAITAAISAQSPYKIVWGPGTEAYATERVSFAIDNDTLQQLLDALLKGSPCHATIQAETIEIEVK
ncbi:MAG: hypothetical protein KDA92_25220, partial [Planctomycetales bacterium]|nr:hypothetical protein [Planctomycetales bacterium]